MNDNNPLKAVYKLTQKTRAKEIYWQKEPAAAVSFSNSQITEDYKTNHNGECLRLVVVDRVDEEEEVSVHSTRVHLQILNTDGGLIWEFPEHDSITDLLNSIRFQVGNVEDRINRLLL